MVTILSPMPTGNGAYVLHRQLEAQVPAYRVQGYSPWWTLVPMGLPWFARGKGVHLIHTALDYACFFKRPRIPLVATIHNYVLDAFMASYSSTLQRFHYKTDLKAFTRISLAVSDRVTAVSQYIADKLQQDLQRPTEIQVIYNGVDEKRFCPPAVNRQQRRPFRILFCGNLSRRKRADLIVPLAKALGKAFEIRYTAGLGGSGILKDGAKSMAELVALGRIPHDKIQEVYQSVDALFMPSVREGFGLCVAEAMACGLPVVANRCSAIPELVLDGEGGFLCEIGRVDEYAQAFRQLAEERTLCRDMGGINRARVEQKFTLGGMVKAYEDLFELVMDSR